VIKKHIKVTLPRSAAGKDASRTTTTTLNQYRLWADEQLEKAAHARLNERLHFEERISRLLDTAEEIRNQRDALERNRTQLTAENKKLRDELELPIRVPESKPVPNRDAEAKPDHKSRILEAASRDFAGLSQGTQRYLIDWATGVKPTIELTP